MAPVSCLSNLERNPKNVFLKALSLLLVILENVIREPNNSKYRVLRLSNRKLVETLLSAVGGRECLLYLGFKEDKEQFVLPSDVPVEKLRLFRNELIYRKSLYTEDPSTEQITEKKVELQAAVNNQTIPGVSTTPSTSTAGTIVSSKTTVIPPLQPVQISNRNPFILEIVSYFNQVLQYEDYSLQQKALQIIPVNTLENSSMKKMRLMQAAIKSGELKEQEVDIRDILLCELLSWFKNSFFKWVDSPPCITCKGPTRASGNMYSSADQCRVEVYKCSANCNGATYFPRYNSVEKLLTTRQGRCGEWANCFTFLARAMGWEARFVLDQTDHVWTEVYSPTQKRWLHCDPCENVCDTPLMYEVGWGKKLSYVIAFSAEEVQDVTWRYSYQHQEVMKRRTRCPEQELLSTLFTMREMRQKPLSEARKKYLNRRILSETVEFLTPKKPTEAEQSGRTSGSLAWRLMRGELGSNTQFTPNVWTVTSKEKSMHKIHICYSAAQDKYVRCVSGEELVGWENGIVEREAIFRKHETDWNMVYLARNENSKDGKIKWKFDFSDSGLLIDTIKIRCSYQLYESGAITRLLCDQNNCIRIPPESELFETSDMSGSSSVSLEVQLSGGNGNVAWQHAQLFRQKSDDLSYPLEILITLREP